MFKKTLLTVLLASGFAMSAAHAADGTINFTGKILETTCEFNGGNDLDVELGTWNASNVGAAGAELGNAPFKIQLANCDDTLVSGDLTFTGTPDATNASLLQLTSGGAEGVGIALYDSKGTLLPMGKSTPFTITGAAGAKTASIDFVAKYQSTGVKVKAGEANAVTEFQINYK